MRWVRYSAVALLLLLLGMALWMALAPSETAPETTARDSEATLTDGDDAAEDARAAPDRTARRRHEPTADDPSEVDDSPGWRPYVFGSVAAEEDDRVVPCGGALVRIYHDDPLDDDDGHALSTAVTAPVAEQITGADGRFEFRSPPGAWRIVVSASGGLGTHARGRNSEDVGELLLYELERVEVRVEDEDEKPIEDAYAYLYAATFDVFPVGIARAGPDGTIALDPAPGALLVTAPGREFVRVTNPGGSIDVTLARGLDLAGRVVDGQGAPLAGVRLFVEDEGARRTTRSGEDGSFRFERISAADEIYVWLRVGDDLFPRLVGYGETNAHIVIPRRGDIAGIVVYADGTPAAEATVDGARVDEDGRFVIWTEGHERNVTLDARISGHVPGYNSALPTHVARQELELRPGATTDIRLVLEEAPHSFLRVRVLTPDGESVPGCSVRLTPNVWTGRWHYNDVTLVVASAAPGTVFDATVTDSHRAHLPYRGSLTTSARSDVIPVEVRLGAVEPVTLRVFAPDGEELERHEWTRLDVVQAGLLDDGRISAAPGKWIHVLVEARGRQLARRLQVPSAAPHELHVRFPSTARVTGRLVRGDDRPAQRLRVVVVPHASVGAHHVTTSAADGTFALDDVPAGGAVFVVWQSDDVQAQRRRIVVPDSGELDLGEMLAWEDVELEGRVVVPSGESAAGLHVEVWWDEGSESASTMTDADGSYRLRVPGAPDAVVNVTRRGRLFGVVPVDLSSTRRKDVHVQRVGTIRVHMGEDWAARSFDVFMATTDRSTTWPTSCEWIDQGRVVVIEEAPAGTWLLRVVHGDEIIERTVHVTPGEETQLQLER